MRVTRFAVVLVVLMLMLGGVASPADQAKLTWDNPTTREDGTAFNPASDIGSFKVYYGVTNPPTVVLNLPVSASYPSVALNQTYTITQLSNATTYYFQISVVDKYGKESGKSVVVSKTTALPPSPSGCSNVRVE